MTAPPTTCATEVGVADTLRRAGLYRVLAAAFAYPTPPRVADVARAASTLAVGVPPGPLREVLAAFAVAAWDADADALAEEHVFLFDRQVRCPAWESAWADVPQMAGKPALLADVAGFYTAFGLEPAGAQPDTEDHLVAELEFMSALALKEAWASGEGDPAGTDVTRGAARSFLTDHLGRWAESFAEELAGATPIAFYVAAAHLLAAWVRTDVAALAATPTRVGSRVGADRTETGPFTCPMAAEAPETDDFGPPA
jgi:DMSO reductase family type II enzyme chaperone